MKLSELVYGLSLSLPEQEIREITCDSRKVTAGDIFVCIAGTAVDGHAFADYAAKQGAAIIFTQRDMGLPNQVVVPDTRYVWGVLCANRFGRPAEKLKLVGVTGTNGKTTTTFLLKGILEAAGYTVGLVGTIQNMIGQEILPSGHTTPDPYDLQAMFARMVEEGCTHAVMEVSSHALDQHRVAGCPFAVGLFTNLTQDHLDYHVTMEQYMQAKKRLFLQSDVGFLNADDAYAKAMAEGLSCSCFTYSLDNEAADYAAQNVALRPDGVDFTLKTPYGSGAVKLAIPGRFSVYNATGAACCALALGVPFDTVIEALCMAKGVKGRAEIVPVNCDFTVVIDYAHTPDGLENICRTLNACKTGRLWTVFGCGGDRDRTKRPEMGRVAAELSDVVVVTSDNPRSEDPAAIIEEIVQGMQGIDTPYTVMVKREEAIRYALTNAQAGDTVLLAGKGHETYQIVKDGTVHLDEREVVAQVLGE